jgi:polyisoprenoid-binding protein YceI
MKAKLLLVAILAVVVGSANAQELKVDVSKSTLQWTGKKVTGEHTGKIGLKEGTFTLKNNKFTAGKFVINMNSLTNEDLPAGEWNDKLVGHLKSDDFFGVATYPEAVLEITGSTPLTNGKAKVSGKLTIKGITNPVEFEATQSGSTYTALITVDRSLYNVRYGSGKFFENLGDKTIYDDFTLNVKLAVN